MATGHQNVVRMTRAIKSGTRSTFSPSGRKVFLQIITLFVDMLTTASVLLRVENFM